jgi:Transposase domain (DUF772)
MMGTKERNFQPLPENISLEDLVPDDNFYRRLQAKLDLSFVRELVEDLYAASGRPSVDPKVFFSLQLVMFHVGIRSERELMRIVCDRLSVRWYVGVRRLIGRWISPTGRRGSEECWTCEQQKGGHREDSNTPGSTAYPEAKAIRGQQHAVKAGGARRRLRH